MAITIDQSSLGFWSSRDALGNTWQLTTTATVSSNAFIVLNCCWVASTGGVTLSSISGGGLSWSIDKQGNADGVSGVALISAQAPSGLPSSTVLTATVAGGVCDVKILTGSSLFGVKTSSPVDGTPVGPTLSAVGTAWATASYTVTTAGSILIGPGFNQFNSSTNTPTGPAQNMWTVYDAGDSQGTVGEYLVAAAPGSYSLAGTWGTSTQTTSIAVAYLAAPTGPSNVVIPRRATGSGRW